MIELFTILSRAAMQLTTSPTTVSVSDAPTPLPLDSVVLTKGSLDADPATATFTVPSSGDYEVTMNLSGDWNNSNDLEIALWVNGSQVGQMLSQNGRGARHQAMVWTAYLNNLSSGDTIQVQMLDADGGSFDVDVYSCNLACARIG